MQRFCWIKTRRQANLGLGEETQGSELFWSPEAIWKALKKKKKGSGRLLIHISLVLETRNHLVKNAIICLYCVR